MSPRSCDRVETLQNVTLIYCGGSIIASKSGRKALRGIQFVISNSDNAFEVYTYGLVSRDGKTVKASGIAVNGGGYCKPAST